jgi:hypothetical protein
MERRLLEPTDDEIQRVADALGVPGFMRRKRGVRGGKRDTRPLPRKVLVQRLEGDYGRGPIFFFSNERENGRREQMFNTRHIGLARKEAERFIRLGVPMAVYREWGV